MTMNNNKKLPKILLFKQYFELSNKKHKNKKYNNIFMTNVNNKRNKNQINLNSFEKKQNKKNKVSTPKKEITEQKNNNYNINSKNMFLIKKNYDNFKNKEKKQLLTSPNIINYNKLATSARRFTCDDKKQKRGAVFINASKFAHDNFNYSNRDNEKKHKIIVKNNYFESKSPMPLVNKIKTRNLDKELLYFPSSTTTDEENKMKYHLSDFQALLIKSKIKLSKNSQ